MFVLIDQNNGPQMTTPDKLFNSTQVEEIAGIQDSKPQAQEYKSPGQIQQALNKYKMKSKYYKPQQVYFAKDIMTRHVYTVQEDTLLASVLTDFLQKGYSHIPIVDEERRVKGLISGQEIHKWNKRVWTQSETAGMKEFAQASLLKEDVVCAKEDTTIRLMANIMLERGIGCIPVIDDETRILGIVTHADMLKAMVRETPLETWI